MVIYKITNLINGKGYVGLTTQPFNHRWSEHKYSAKKNKPDIAIDWAIKKYGAENFKYEEIDTAVSIGELYSKETELIIKLGTLVPNGYNVDLYNPVKIVNERTKSKLSVSSQGVNHKNDDSLSKYLGVLIALNIYYYAVITSKKEKYSIRCENELDAATTYDKLALYFFGKDAKINFPLNRDEYLSLDLQKFFVSRKRKYSSEYLGVYYDKRRKKWKMTALKKTKDSKTLIANTEIEAAEIYDKYKIYKNIDLKKLNFPNRLEEFKRENLKDLFEYDYKYVCCLKNGKWRAHFNYDGQSYFLGNFTTENQARTVVKRKRKELGIND